MGRRGPPPKPTKLKVLEGNPGKRKLNSNEPQPQRGKLPCPTHLPDEAKKVWKRVVPELDRLGLLTIVDKELLIIYCQSYADWFKATEWIKEHGDVFAVKDEKGKVKYVQQMPQVAIASKAAERVHKIAQQFGLTPAARASLSVESSGKQVSQEAVRKFVSCLD